MTLLESTAILAVPIETVFAFVSNSENRPKWVTDTLDTAKLTPGPVGVGTQFRSTGKENGQPVESEIRVTAFTPNALYAFSGGGDLPFSVQHTFQTVQGGTKVTITFNGDLSTAPFTPQALGKEIDHDLNTLKTLLETT